MTELTDRIGAKTGIPSTTLNLAVEIAYNAYKARTRGMSRTAGAIERVQLFLFDNPGQVFFDAVQAWINRRQIDLHGRLFAVQLIIDLEEVVVCASGGSEGG